MDNVTVKINNMDVIVPAGTTVLEAARMAGIEIPTLCFLKGINEIGDCRMCVVEVKGARTLVTACVYPVAEGMEIKTNTAQIRDARRKTLQLLLSSHDRDCLACVGSGKCELQAMCEEYDVQDAGIFDGARNHYELDTTAVHMVRDNNKCILCRRCISACENVQGIGVIGMNGRGFATYVASAFDMGLGDTSCVCCGQCITACPTGALYEKDYTEEVFRAIEDPDKVVLVQPAPAVRAGLGEEFGYPIGTDVEGKLAAALRRLGFDKVFDTKFSADLTIMEEATEFLDRVSNGGTLPLITSCSPGWVKFCEHYFPDLIDNLSSCKSPQQMFGAIAKTYYAEKAKIDPKKIVMVSVMPCTAKKFEIGRDDQSAAGVADVDISITTRELARMIKRAGIKFTELPDEGFDDPLGLGTGAGVIFGATGGVMEAALRTAVEKLTGEQLVNLDFKDVRGTEGIKEATYKIAGKEVNVCVCSGLANARKVLDDIRAGKSDYHFIEVMACPGGCVNGGGQPKVASRVSSHVDVRAERAKVLYGLDANDKIRKSHENPAIKALYDEYLGEPGSHKAHEILHTTYVKRGVNTNIE